MDLATINQQLATLKAQAAKINAEINSAPNREIKRLKTAEYMTISANIAELRNSKTLLQTAEKQSVKENKKNSLKVTNLYFPKEQRIQYYATSLSIVDLLLLLQEVFEAEVPAVTSFFSVPEEQVSNIPPSWFELLNEEDEQQSVSQ